MGRIMTDNTQTLEDRLEPIRKKMRFYKSRETVRNIDGTRILGWYYTEKIYAIPPMKFSIAQIFE